MNPETVDARLYFLPPSPSDTNPPLGPAILARAASHAGRVVEVRDLNIEFISRFAAESDSAETYKAVGDQGKDRALVGSAARFLFDSFRIPAIDCEYVPDVADANAGMHFSRSGVEAALERHMSSPGWLANWLSDVLETDGSPPSIVGVSIMGPSQVLPSLLLANLVKRRWPMTLLVGGGSHVTLLEPDRLRGAVAWPGIDIVLVGHSENEFVKLLGGARTTPALSAGSDASGPPFEYSPLFASTQLERYLPGKLTIPVQFTRGCSYGRCTYCTYPVIEPVTTPLYPGHAARAMAAAASEYGSTRFSLKDSLFTAPMLSTLAAEVEALTVPLVWSATTKLTRTMAGLAAQLAAGGLRTLEFGVESINPRVQSSIDKRVAVSDVEYVIQAMSEAGIVSVVNLMFGFPEESLQEAEHQLEWALSVQESYGAELVDFSLNMLEVVRGSPMERMTEQYQVNGIAPWAYAYSWEAPGWRTEFAPRLVPAEAR